MVSGASSSPLLAACCGPAVTTWDYTAHPHTAEVDLSTSFNKAHGEGESEGEASGGVRIFKPHGDDCVLSGIGLNHNGQVLATCTSSTSPSSEPNVSLTHAATGTRLESFSNFFPDSLPPAAATSIGFGGKSRYLVVSDTSGCASVWDMKKRSRVRTFRLPPPPTSPSTAESDGGGCTAAVIDPTDTFVAAASGWTDDGSLRLYRLREGKLVATLREPSTAFSGSGLSSGSSSSLSVEGQSHGGICPGALHFSSLEPKNVAVGTRDGTVLVWDVDTSVYLSTNPTKPSSVPSILLRRHGGPVTGVAFSPVNRVLLSSCSADGTVSFHDVNTRRAIQSFTPPVLTDASSMAAAVGMSSVSFGPDGVTCAAGTNGGEVFLYDLRKAGSGPISTLRFVGSSGGAASDATAATAGPTCMPVVSVKFVEIRGTSSKSGGATPRSVRRKKEAADAESVAGETAAASETSRKVAEASASVASSKLSIASSVASPVPALKEQRVKKAAGDSKPMASIGSGAGDAAFASEASAGASVNSSVASPVPAPKARDKEKATLDSSEPLAATGSGAEDDADAAEASSSAQVASAALPVADSPDAKAKSGTRSPDQAAKTIRPGPHSLEQGEGRPSAPEASEAPPLVSESPRMLNEDPARPEVSTSSKEPGRARVISDLTKTSVSKTAQDLDEAAQITSDAVGLSRHVQQSDKTIRDIHDGRRVSDHDDNRAALSPEEFASTLLSTAREAQTVFPSGVDNAPDVKVNKLVLRNLVEGAVDDLREDMEGAMRNLHVDILRQFQLQSDEMRALFAKQEETRTNLLDENRELREENERLRRSY